MKNVKKLVALVLAISAVLTIATSTMTSSALFGWKLEDGKIGWGIGQGIIDSIFNKNNSCTNNTTAATTDDTTTDDTTATTEEKQPLINFYFDYNVVRTLKWGFCIGKVPTSATTATTEQTTEATTATTEATTEATTQPAAVVKEEETPNAAFGSTTTEAAKTATVTEAATPKASIANTGDAGLSALAAVSAVAAAAFVIAKRK